MLALRQREDTGESDFLRRQGKRESSAEGAARMAELRRGQGPALWTGLFSLCGMKPHQPRMKNEGEEGRRVRGGRAWSVRKQRRELGQGAEADTIAPLQVGAQYAFYMRPALGGADVYSQLPQVAWAPWSREKSDLTWTEKRA